MGKFVLGLKLGVALASEEALVSEEALGSPSSLRATSGRALGLASSSGSAELAGISVSVISITGGGGSESASVMR